MEESNTFESPQKPKTSKLALTTFLTPAILWLIGIFCFPGSYLIFKFHKARSNGLIGLILPTGLCLLLLIIPVTTILFFVTFHKIKKNNGSLKGKRYAIEGIILAFGLIAMTVLLFLIYFAPR